MTTLKDRYQLLNQLIDAALFKFHPDTYQGDNRENAERMTRGLIAARRKARETYQRLTQAERAQIAAEVRDDR